MARIQETTVYKFNELSDGAKEVARAWYREGQLDFEWYDSVYEDADTIAKILGIEIDRKKQNNPKAHAQPTIWFSGFYSQGDGACFEGRYSFVDKTSEKIREYAPLDSCLHQIADHLTYWQAQNYNALYAIVKHRGNYYHEMSTDIDVISDDNGDLGEPGEMTDGAEENVKDVLRDFMRWIYRALEKECEYLQSDEQVDAAILVNEYEFTEDGATA